MLEFFAQNFQNYLWLAVILIAMIPSLEAKISIPFALSLSLKNLSISTFDAFLYSFIGSMIPCLFILLLCKFLKKKSTGFLYDKFTNIINKKYLKNSKKIQKNSKIRSIILLSLFVAIPLPLTGVWSGSLIGGLSNLTIFESFISIFIGSFISCLIILFICLLLGNSVIYFLIISLIIIFIYIFINFLISRKKKTQK